jgi:hypothetical protein
MQSRGGVCLKQEKLLMLLLMLAVIGATGCDNPSSDIQTDRTDERIQSVQEVEQDFYANSQEIAECYRDIYEQAKK